MIMNKKKLVMATLLVFTLTTSMFSATAVHAQEELLDTKNQREVSTITAENDSTEHHFDSGFDSSLTTATHHYLTCTDEGCSETKAEAHKLIWYIKNYADDKTAGEAVEQCEVCGYETGNEREIPAFSGSPVFTADTTIWDGESDLTFQIDAQGLNINSWNVYYRVELEGGTIGETEIPHNYGEEQTGILKLSASDIAIKDRLSNFGFTWDDVKEIVFGVNFTKTDSFDGISQIETHLINREISIKPDSTSTEPGVPTYSPTLSLTSSTWTGENDIVLNTQAKGGNVELAEIYLYISGVSIGGIRVTPEIKLDSEGNGLITFNNSDLKNAKMFGPNGGEAIDWTEIDKMEISFSYELAGEYKIKTVYVPVDFKTSNPTGTTTITSDSGVTMVLPENAPDNLKLKVIEITDTDEKSAIDKVVNIDGDKIKIFDLSLLLNGQVYEYNGQFTSTVSFPVPDGWDMSRLALYYFNEDTKEVTPVTFSVDKENGTVVFSTNHFSKYVLVQKDTTTAQSTQAANIPKTGDQTNTGLYISLFAMSALGIVVLAVLEKKKALGNK